MRTDEKMEAVLTAEQIKPLIRGAVAFSSADGALTPHRFTEAQEQAYAAYSESLHKKTFASAGMRLQFRTDSRRISLQADLRQASSRPFAGFDVYANGALVKSELFPLTGEVTSVTLRAELPERPYPSCVTVYLPWSASTALRTLTLDGTSFLEPTERGRVMLCFGDSITQGYDCRNPSFSYVNRLADALGVEVIDKGIGAEIFFPELSALADDVDPEIITVAYGTNDWSRSTKAAFDRDAKAFYGNLSRTYPKARIFAISPVWRQNMDAEDKSVGPFSYVHEYLSEVARGLPNVIPINGLSLVPHERRFFPGDGLHPSDEGFRHYANNLYAEMKKYL